jgi:putative Mn2+ efflux pump MntP
MPVPGRRWIPCEGADMSDFSIGDILFIVLIFCVIHGIMTAVGWMRRRKTDRTDKG